MGKHLELKERREANEFATNEFNRVKRAKLELERAKSISSDGEKKEEKQKDRERANRASAAASRAKIVFYCKELEKRTDRLEHERNRQTSKAERATRKLKTLREEVSSLKKILRDLWAIKDQKTCSFLVDSGALFLLASRQEETEQDDDDNDSQNEQDQTTWNKIGQVESSAETSIQQPSISTPIPHQQQQQQQQQPSHITATVGLQQQPPLPSPLPSQQQQQQHLSPPTPSSRYNPPQTSPIPASILGQKREYQVLDADINQTQERLPTMPKIRHLIHPTTPETPLPSHPSLNVLAGITSQQMTNRLPPCSTQQQAPPFRFP